MYEIMLTFGANRSMGGLASETKKERNKERKKERKKENIKQVSWVLKHRPVPQ